MPDKEYRLATYVSSRQVVCPLPPDGAISYEDGPALLGYKLSISNDGETFGDDALLIVYDSTCFHCAHVDQDMVCQLKVSLTHITDQSKLPCN